MKRLLLYGLILMAACALPTDRQDVANLEPIQAVWLYEQEGMVHLETDTQDQGAGLTVEGALSDMKYNSPGVVYLDTAQYLLVSENATEYISQIAPLLKGSVRVCLWQGKGEVADGARYMRAHRIGVTLRRWDGEENLPKIPV